MAKRFRPLKIQPGALIAAGLIALIFGTLMAVVQNAGGFSALGPWDWRAVWFTVWQAIVSASVSVLSAIPVARALTRRRFHGRRLLITLLGAPFILPVIVAIIGLVTIFGRSGLVSTALSQLGLDAVSIYGWHGVILAHVFFNMPLAVRMILHGWQAIPAERFRLAASLGFSPADINQHLERPMLREVFPGAWLAIFLVSLMSFAVALTLGGGPRATTIELAIYQAFRFDFDLGKAATLGLIQVALCLVAFILSWRISAPAGFGVGMDSQIRLQGPKGWRRWTDGLIIALASAFLLLPIISVVLKGAPYMPDLPSSVWAAALRSIIMALISAFITISLSLSLALTIASGRHWVELAGMLPLVASPLVLGTGLYLILQPFTSPLGIALPLTVAINAIMSLPFALRILIPATRILQTDYGRLAESLGLHGIARLRYLTLPRLAHPLGFAGGLSAAFAMGDLGVIALFANSSNATLPLKLYQLMNSYQLDAAAACAVLLMLISFSLFWILDNGERLNAAL